MRTGLSKNLLMGAAIVATGAVQMKEGVGQGRVAHTNKSALGADGGNTFLQQKMIGDGTVTHDNPQGAVNTGTPTKETGNQVQDAQEHEGGVTALVNSKVKNSRSLYDQGVEDETPSDETGHAVQARSEDELAEAPRISVDPSGNPSKLSDEQGNSEVGDRDSMQGLLGKPNSFGEDSASYEEGSSGPATDSETAEQKEEDGKLASSDLPKPGSEAAKAAKVRSGKDGGETKEGETKSQQVNEEKSDMGGNEAQDERLQDEDSAGNIAGDHDNSEHGN